MATWLRATAAEMVNQATNEKLKERDWITNIEICELVSRDPGKAKDVVKSIKKRLKNKHANSQLFAILLLEMLMNNCGEHVHKQVIDNAVLPILVKIVKKKTDLPVRERIFLLLDATQTALGGASGRFPQYYNAYYDVVASGVQFAQHRHVMAPQTPDPRAQVKSTLTIKSLLQNHENDGREVVGELIANSSIIQKASSVLEVLRDALNALGSKNPEGAMDEFVLDLVEQCSFQKQKVMHLVMTSRDEKVVTEAIELNEQLHQVLTCHDSLLSVHPTTVTNLSINEEQEEEDAERLYRRLCKGKACAEADSEQLVGSFRIVPQEKMHRPLIRPLPSDFDGKQKPLRIQPSDPESAKHGLSIPPPPAKHMERENFFRDNNVDGLGLAVDVRGLSLHRCDGNSSGSGGTDCSAPRLYDSRD